MTNEQATDMRRELARHYDEPVMPASEYCEKFETWVRAVEELNRGGGARAHGSEWVSFAQRIMQDVRKSNLLYRLLYLGEPLRTRKCPMHGGSWSGVPVPGEECPHGCGHTGWLPER
jgi:hypothetical protein